MFNIKVTFYKKPFKPFVSEKFFSRDIPLVACISLISKEQDYADNKGFDYVISLTYQGNIIAQWTKSPIFEEIQFYCTNQFLDLLEGEKISITLMQNHIRKHDQIVNSIRKE